MKASAVKNASAIESRRRAMRRAKNGPRDADAWNATNPIGTLVNLTRDDGTVEQTFTRSAAWCLGDGTPVILVGLRAGGYLLDRIRRRM